MWIHVDLVTGYACDGCDNQNDYLASLGCHEGSGGTVKVMGKSKAAKVAAFVELDPKKVLKMEPEERASWLSEVCRFAVDGIVQASQLYNVLSSEKFGEGLSDKAAKRIHRTMLKNLSGLAKLSPDPETEAKEMMDYKSVRRKGDEDAAARMEEMMARCRNFVRAKADTFEDRMREAEQREEQARRAERLRREREERERLAKEWAEIEAWHAPMERWEASQLAAEDLRTQERMEMEAEVRAALRTSKGSRSRSRRKRRSSSQS
eukprot:s1165_g7.t1